MIYWTKVTGGAANLYVVTRHFMKETSIPKVKLKQTPPFLTALELELDGISAKRINLW
jgi:hypothetical protein